jgi:hypothetical protein
VSRRARNQIERKARGIEAHVIHASSVAVSREHRRAKTDRLNTELLKRGFLGWLIAAATSGVISLFFSPSQVR